MSRLEKFFVLLSATGFLVMIGAAMAAWPENYYITQPLALAGAGLFAFSGFCLGLCWVFKDD